MITVKFSCKLCGLKIEPVMVRYRRDDEDVAAWIEKEVAEAVGLAHSLLSPACKSSVMESLMIPIEDKNLGIGMKP